MQEMSGNCTVNAACPLDSSTGPGAEASTGAGDLGFKGDDSAPFSAGVRIHITHNQVTIEGTLDLGHRVTVSRTWQRRNGSRTGWVLVGHDSEFISEEDQLSVELATFLDGLDFPYAVANMLPGKRASAQAIAAAAEALEVAHA